MRARLAHADVDLGPLIILVAHLAVQSTLFLAVIHRFARTLLDELEFNPVVLLDVLGLRHLKLGLCEALLHALFVVG